MFSHSSKFLNYRTGHVNYSRKHERQLVASHFSVVKLLSQRRHHARLESMKEETVGFITAVDKIYAHLIKNPKTRIHRRAVES